MRVTETTLVNARYCVLGSTNHSLPAADVNKRIVKEEMSDDDGTFVIDGTMEQIDPAVLSNLPQSLQLEVISKLRERKVQANREAFQKRQAEPKSFSDFQLEEYLKASQMR